MAELQSKQNKQRRPVQTCFIFYFLDAVESHTFFAELQSKAVPIIYPLYYRGGRLVGPGSGMRIETQM